MRCNSLTSKASILILSFFILLTAFFSSHAATIEELQAKLNQLRQQDQLLEQKADGFRTKVTQTNQQIQGIKRDIDGVTYEINALETEIERTQNDIELTQLQIQKLGLEVEKALAEIESDKVKTVAVIKSLYQAEHISSFELMLSGSNFSDFWDQHQYFSSFQTSLNGLIHQMEILKVDLESKIGEQRDKQKQLQNLQKKSEIQQDTLSDKRDQQKTLLAQNEKQKSQYQQNLSQTEGERQRLIEQILQTEEEVKRLHNFELYFKSGKVPPPGTKIFTWPAQSRRVTQGYGATAFARSRVAGYTFHNGIDIDGEIGDPIFAAGPGKVIGASTGAACPNYGRLRDFTCQGGWGNWIAIQHPNGLVTLYGHMARQTTLTVGSIVDVGQTVGFIGASGNVTGSHLHFSVYSEFFLVPKGYPGYNPEGTLNPLLYL